MPESSTPAATDQQIVERLAVEVMGWRKHDPESLDCEGWWGKGEYELLEQIWAEYTWNPLTDWNHFRQVEEKVFADPSLTLNFLNELHNPSGMGTLNNYVMSDLRTRCLALISVLDSSHAINN